MPDVIKLNYPAMREMATQCKQTAERLRDTVSLAQKIAQQMQNGALVGDAGSAFSAALTGPFVKSVGDLAHKFDEVAGDIEGAISDMTNADASKTTALFDN